MSGVRRRVAAVLVLVSTMQATFLPRATRRAHATSVARRSEGRGHRVGDIAFFTACGAREGCELWKTDGTAAGTRLVKDIVPGHDGSGPNWLTPADDRLYFTARDAIHGCELWRTDGTEAGTVVLDLVRGAGSSCPRELTRAGSTLYFLAEHPDTGEELWKSDGRAAGTAMVKEFAAGTPPSGVSDLTPAGDHLYFTARAATGNERELYRTDGTAAGTKLLKRGRAIFLDSWSRQPVLRGEFYFQGGEDDAYGRELWKTDGTPAGTVLVKDIVPGPESTHIQVLTTLGSRIVFEGFTPEAGVEPWVTDGTVAATVPLADIDPGPASSMSRAPYGTRFVRGSGPLAEVVFFTANVSGRGEELWKTDGTRRGTARIWPPTTSAAKGLLYLMPAGRYVFFRANDGVHGDELWRTDGTTAGTVLVSDVHPGAEGSNPMEFVVEGGSLYLFAFDGHRRGIWKADGTTALPVSSVPESAYYLTPLPRGLVFVAGGEKEAYRLWSASGGKPAAPLTEDLLSAGR